MDRALQWARYATGLAALVFFTVALTVHVTALLGNDVEATWPEVWLLHYGVFPFILAAALTLGRLAVPSRRFLDAMALLPIWSRLLIAVAFIYAMANFFIMTSHSVGGVPLIKDGHHYLNNHGTLTELTPAEFAAHRALVLRGFSGHWLFLYLTSALVLLTAAKKPT